jgi:hypothetical protein
VIGADIPSFALYKDQTVIALRSARGAKAADYVTKRLDDQSLENFAKKLRALSGDPKWDKRYKTRSATDQPETQVFVQLENGAIATSIYGPLSVWKVDYAELKLKDPDLAAQLESDGKALEANIAALPIGLRDILNYTKYFNMSGATRWKPKFIEVMLWPCRDGVNSDGVKSSTTWPRHWPGLISQYARKREDQYSIYLDSGNLNALKRLESRSKGVTFIDGNGWCINHRFVLPSEPTWMAIFNNLYK